MRSGDPRADRILLVGNGPSHGWGVLTHQLALTGQLADAVAARTGRACDADLVGAEAMNVRSALAWIGDRDLRDIDALVLVLGFNDALRLTPLATWESELTALLDGIASRTARRRVVTLVGIPPVASFRSQAGPLARLTDRHRRRLNAATQRIADEPRPRLPRSPRRRDAARRGVGRGLSRFRRGHRRRHRPAPARRAPGRPRRVRPSRTRSGTGAAPPPSSNSPARAARPTCAASPRSPRSRSASSSPSCRSSTATGCTTAPTPMWCPPRCRSSCRSAASRSRAASRSSSPTPARTRDSSDNPLVDVSFINFYAGYPLRATDGQVIGSFCLQGSQPRRESAIALDLLRQLALEAQEVLRGYENEVPQLSYVQPTPSGEPDHLLTGLSGRRCGAAAGRCAPAAG